MHQEAYDLAASALSRYRENAANVLDVGSYDVNGTLRPLIEGRGFRYTGLDVRSGPNVDVVSEDPEHYPALANTFDIVTCANALHNIARPWLVVPEMVRILRPGGLLIIVTIYQHGLNRYPLDYWRITPDGLRVLFDEAVTLNEYDLQMDDKGNTLGSAFKV